MANLEVSARLFEKNMHNMINGMVWKNKEKATEAQNNMLNIHVIEADKFTAASRKLLEIYSASELQMIADYTQEKFISFRNKTPTKYVRFLDTFYYYEETNDYYRMLYGLPPYECEDKYIATMPYGNARNIPHETPIHTLPYNTRVRLEREGYLDRYKKIAEIDSTFEYVNFMTTKRIHPFKARLADRFELLYVPDTEIDVLARDFKEVYEESRLYIMHRYYSDAYRGKKDQYEGFIGLAVLFMTIQRMHTKYLETDITRDFYDLDSIKVIYDAYSVPFYEEIPVIYHQRVVKLINRLISYKGSDKVFFDLCALFDFDTLKIYQYYLLKKQKFDENGTPVIITKEDGSLDSRAMFDICFVEGTIGGDPYLDVTNPQNELNYWGVTDPDPHWFNDADLMDRVYNMEYNYIETKYIGLQLVFSITKFMLESCYFVRMIMDNREKVDNIRVSHGKLGTDVDLFTLIIYIHALICEDLGYEGEIPDAPEQIAKVLGFNFVETVDELISIIQGQANPDKADKLYGWHGADQFLMDEETSRILEALMKIDITDAPSCKKAYTAITDIFYLIEKKLWEVKDHEVYFAYKKLYKLLMTTKMKSEVFMKSDGTQAKTYKDLLEDLDMTLAIRLDSLSKKELSSELQYSLIALQKVCDTLKYIQSFGSVAGEVIVQYLYKLIMVFKSAKVELLDFKLVYIIDFRTTNWLKFLAEQQCLSIDVDIPGDEFELFDQIALLVQRTTLPDQLSLEDYNIIRYMRVFITEFMLLIEEWSCEMHVDARALQNLFGQNLISLFDYLNHVELVSHTKDSFKISESFSKYTEKGKVAPVTVHVHENYSYADMLSGNPLSVDLGEDLSLMEKFTGESLTSIPYKPTIKFRDSMSYQLLFNTYGINNFYRAENYVQGNLWHTDVGDGNSLMVIDREEITKPSPDIVRFHPNMDTNSQGRMYIPLKIAQRNPKAFTVYAVLRFNPSGNNPHGFIPIIGFDDKYSLSAGNVFWMANDTSPTAYLAYGITGTKSPAGLAPVTYDFDVIALTYDGDEKVIKFFFNGKLLQQTEAEIKSLSQITIGGRRLDNGKYAINDGDIDLKFFALSIDEVYDEVAISNSNMLLDTYKR